MVTSHSTTKKRNIVSFAAVCLLFAASSGCGFVPTSSMPTSTGTADRPASMPVRTTETFTSLPKNTKPPKATSTAEANAWIGIGPWVDINVLAVDPATPAIVYAGTGGGIFKSMNGGQQWNAINSGLSDRDILDLVIDPVTPNTIYAAASVQTVNGGGVFKSTNGGENWSAVNNGLPSHHVSKLAIDPRTPTTLYAVTFSEGLFKSTNGGESWTGINRGLSDSDMTMVLQVDPVTPHILYLGTYSGGVFKSLDGGESWNAVNHGLDLDTPYGNPIDQVAIDPMTPTTLYAKTRYTGIFKSTNSGQDWAAFDTGLPWADASYYRLSIDPLTPATLYIGTSSGQLFKSTDGGKSWQMNNNTGLNNNFIVTLAIDPLDPTILYIGTAEAGIFTNQTNIAFAPVQMPSLTPAPFAPTESSFAANSAPTESISPLSTETLSVRPTLARLELPFTASGSLTYRKEIQLPENARLLVLWSVAAERPYYEYIFGEGTIDSGNNSFRVVFDEPPPSEALNWMGSSAMGVGVVIITTDQTLQSGKVQSESVSTTDILGASGQYGIIYVNDGFEIGEYIPWFNEFNPGYNAGKGLDIPDDVFDEFEPVDPGAIEIIIDNMENIEFVNWS